MLPCRESRQQRPESAPSDVLHGDEHARGRHPARTRNDSIRTLALTPVSADLLEVAEPPRYQAIAPQAVKLRGLGYPDTLVAACTGVTPRTGAKAIRWFMNRSSVLSFRCNRDGRRLRIRPPLLVRRTILPACHCSCGVPVSPLLGCHGFGGGHVAFVDPPGLVNVGRAPCYLQDPVTLARRRPERVESRARAARE